MTKHKIIQSKFETVEEIIRLRPSYGELEKELFRLINRLRNDPSWFLEVLESVKSLYEKGAFFNKDMKIKFVSFEGG